MERRSWWRQRIIRVSAGAILAAGFLVGCATRVVIPTTYYMLDYLAHTERGELVRSEPAPAGVHVLDTRLPRAYSRPQIVQRGVGPEFVYLRQHLWGADLSDAAARLIEARARRYNLFSRTTREYQRQEAEYEIRSALEAIEFVNYEDTHRVGLVFELSLWDTRTGSAVVVHQKVRQDDVFADDVSLFVSQVNASLLGEIDAFFEKVIQFFDTGEPVIARSWETRGNGAQLEPAEQAPEGTGFLVMPALNDLENQPYYTIVPEDGSPETSAQFGRPASLPAGTYTLLYGAGSEEQRMRKPGVRVVPRYRTVVAPDWGALTVDVVDVLGEPVRVRYDIFDAQSGESYGGRVSAAEALVPSETIWVLRPRHHKITINNRSFNTSEDFVTVLVRTGQSERLTIVVGTDENGNPAGLVGAGVVDLEELADTDDPFSFSSAVNGNASFTSTNETESGTYTSAYFLNLELDNGLDYELFPISYQLLNIVAVGLAGPDGGNLNVASDRFELKNTLIYSFTPIYGLYTRIDGSTTLFGKRVVPDEPRDYVKLDDGTVVEQGTGATEIVLSPPFLPAVLKEGFGVNYRAVQTKSVDLSVRGGIGATQTINYGVYTHDGVTTIDGAEYAVYRPTATSFETGFEASAQGSLRLPLDAVLTTNLDVLAPFTSLQAISFEWENVLNLVISRNVSLYYRYLLGNETGDDGLGLVHRHGVFLRLSYLFR